MRKKNSWKKLLVDEKIIHVFASSRIPHFVKRLGVFRGIRLTDATKEEREPYLRLNNKVLI